MKNGSGKTGERYAEELLRSKGYQILERNFHSRFGEIDLIVQNREYIVFVEVKTREEGSLSNPFESITPAKQRKIGLTASFYLAGHPTRLQPRFDAIAIQTRNGQVVGNEHLENAFFFSMY